MADEIDDRTIGSAARERDAASSLLGRVLAEGARLVSSGLVSDEVVSEQQGAYALCRLEKGTDDIRELRAPFELTIGRAPSASPGTWHVADKWLSKAHFRVSAGADGIPVVEDLDSLNGTSVNDRPLTGRRILRRGDAIAAGHSVFVFF
ncbi:MAG: FHA domain-containing protein [Kiritimatiellae bacterium]|nr:FHA domain-containing protein [Kiritimatiellia bacterium]